MSLVQDQHLQALAPRSEQKVTGGLGSLLPSSCSAAHRGLLRKVRVLMAEGGAYMVRWRGQEGRRWRGPARGRCSSELLQKQAARVISGAQACGFLALATQLQLPVYFSTNRMPPSEAVSIPGSLRRKEVVRAPP